jgi:hypothetical protein
MRLANQIYHFELDVMLGRRDNLPKLYTQEKHSGKNEKLSFEYVFLYKFFGNLITAYCLSEKSGPYAGLRQDKTLHSIQINQVGLHRLSSDITHHTRQIVPSHKSAQRPVEIRNRPRQIHYSDSPAADSASDCELSWQAGGSMPAVADTMM